MLKLLVQHKGIAIVQLYSIRLYLLKGSDDSDCTFKVNYNLLQNEDEIDSFEVHVLDNDNNQATNVWALIKPKTIGWSQGRVKVHSDGDKEYQVLPFIFYKCN